MAKWSDGATLAADLSDRPVRFENHVEAAFVDQAVMKDSRSGAKAEASASWPSQGLEVPMIQGEHIENSVALGENDDGSVSKTYAEVPITAQDHSGGGDVLCAEGLQPVGTPGHLFKERMLGISAHSGGQQIVEFGQDERRQEQWPTGLAKRCCRFGVLALTAIDRGQQAAGIEKNHFSPKPASSLSTFSARSDLPLANSGT